MCSCSESRGPPISEHEEPTSTVECRWWAPGPVLPEFGAWFATLGDVELDANHVDLYLLETTRPDRNVKLRRGDKREVKVLTQRVAIDRDDVAGWVERWRKWSSPASADESPPTSTAEVRKDRRLLTLDGCQVELTDALIDGQSWHSVGLEATDSPPGSATLDPILARLSAAGLGGFMSLELERSCGYPQHLLAVLDSPEA